MPTPSIILVSPQLGENIGATARVMSNFGLQDLRVVDPRDGWPNPKAYEMAANGSFVLDKTRVFPTLSEAIADINLLYATTAQERYMNKESITSYELAKDISSHNSDNKVGILFGRERSGLTNEELSLADKLVKIPVSELNPSLNLAQAVGVISYELSKNNNLSLNKPVQQLASKEELEFFLNSLDSLLVESGFLRHEKLKPTMQKNIRNIFVRSKLSDQDIRTLHGIFKSIKEMK